MNDYYQIFNVIRKNATLYALLDSSTGRLICLTNYLRTRDVMSLEPNTHVWAGVNLSNKLPNKLNLNRPFDYVFNTIDMRFQQVELTEEQCQHYTFLCEKAAALDFLYRSVSGEMKQIKYAFSYEYGYEEAEDVVRNGYHKHKHPYITSFSRANGSDAFAIAQELLVQKQLMRAQFDEMIDLSVRYTAQLRDSTSLAEVNQIYDEYNREAKVYGNF